MVCDLAHWMLVLLMLPGASAAPADSSGTIKIHYTSDNQDDRKGHFSVVGLNKQQFTQLRAQLIRSILDPRASNQEPFNVYARPKGNSKLDTSGPPILGSLKIRNRQLQFTPRYPLVRGVVYRAVLLMEGFKPIHRDIVIPKQESPPTVVTNIYPTKNVLPENQLKFYIHFSSPMSRGEAYEHIQLLNSDGQPVEAPFLELDEELWDQTGKRFTLFFDPGRVKRELKPREEDGPVLLEGNTYTLVINKEWKDARRNNLQLSFRKLFQVVGPDNTPPNPMNWRIRSPASNSSGPLIVKFPEPMDAALAGRLIHVTDSKKNRIDGSIDLARDEYVWKFSPGQPWAAGEYFLVVDRNLEDLAGNSVGRPFEVDLRRPIQRAEIAQSVKVRFQID